MKLIKSALSAFVSKKGQEASTWGHLGGWVIALAILLVLIVGMLTAFGVIDIGFIRNLRFG